MASIDSSRKSRANSPRKKNLDHIPGAGSVALADHPALPIPDADWQWFAQAAAQLGVTALPERTLVERCFGHLSGVNAWMNLTRIDGPRDYLRQHWLDSLSILGTDLLRHVPESGHCVDLGSGGGYPGLPLAACSGLGPWTLVDSRGRKVNFLAEACTIPGIHDARAQHFRGREVEHAAPELADNCRLVVTRATGGIDRLADECRFMVQEGGYLIVWQGPAYSGEARDEALAALRKMPWTVLSETSIQLEADSPMRYLVVLQKRSGNS